MERTIGEACPRLRYSIIEEGSCKYCKCYEGVMNGYVICRYSEIPTYESPFNIGDECYYLECGEFINKAKVRECLWYGTEWQYKVTRKHTPVTAYKTLDECKEAKVKIMLAKIKSGIQEAVRLVGKERFLELGKDIKLLQ